MMTQNNHFNDHAAQSSGAGDAEIQQILGLDGSGGRKRIGMHVLIWGMVAAILIAGLVVWRTRDTGGKQRYETRPVTRDSLTITVSATGNLEPTNQVDVGSELSGIVETVTVDYNDRVSVGQVLARLDTHKLAADVTRYRAAQESSQAKVAQARAAVKDAKAQYERLSRASELSGGRIPSAYALEAAEASFVKAQADVTAALAQVKQSKAVLEYAETDLGKAIIRSPIDGIVLSRDVEPGQTVAASLQAPVLFTLAEDLARMELHVDVDEADVGLVEKGQAATFTVDAYPGKTFPAGITQVRYAAQNTGGVVTYETVLQVDNESLLLRPGMTATADITVNRVEDAILVPNAALRFAPPAPPEKGTKAEKEKSTSFTRKLFPRPPRRRERSGNGITDKDKVWVLKDKRPIPVSVATGITDGVKTQITGGDVEPGMAVIVGVIGAVE
ncbi:MAG: efflux RND transporter periplasmic adaptor subunit [Thermodesulfobacteriota bacterium]|nr:efflux RND transporter periplasmic adaptor subunit [Thermodesulfobacteriota bacterium]